MLERIKTLLKSLVKNQGNLLNRALTEPHVNSRLIYLMHGVVSALCILVLAIAFIFAKSKEGYDYMILALSGGHGAAAVGWTSMKKETVPGAEGNQAPAEPPANQS